jgi:hypothetical protein
MESGRNLLEFTSVDQHPSSPQTSYITPEISQTEPSCASLILTIPFVDPLPTHFPPTSALLIPPVDNPTITIQQYLLLKIGMRPPLFHLPTTA